MENCDSEHVNRNDFFDLKEQVNDMALKQATIMENQGENYANLTSNISGAKSDILFLRQQVAELANTHRPDAIKKMVHEALKEFFSEYSGIGKKVIVGTAVVFGSLAVIFGGLKSILAVVGYSITKQ
jgi:dsDNA-specific endonuclease/ATPase MutS2